jgi:hypothetical protein
MSQSYSTIINSLNQFADNHLSVRRFKTSFFDQFNSFSSDDNTFPILYAIPNDVSMDEYIDRYSFRIYCVDILQKDRSNEATILNDTLWVLRDLSNWLRVSDNQLNILNNPRAIPVNSFLTEFTVGWYIDFEIEANGESNDCSIPFSDNFIFSGFTCDFTYVQQFLTCDTLDTCQTIIDINNAIDASIVDGSYDNPSGTLNLIRNDGGIIPVTGFTQSQASTKTLLAGGAEWSGVGLIFDVSQLTYTFTGEILFAGPTSVTLLSGDPTNPRIDAIVVDEAGNITVIQGTPSPDPATPAIPEQQLLVQYVIVAAGATTPNITQEFIYLENTEWTTTTYQTSGTIFGSVNLASTTPPPFEALVCINSNTDQRTGIRFTRASSIDISQYSLLTLRVWIDTALATNKSLQASILLNGVAQGVTVNLNTLGLSRTLTGQWQQVIIPVAAFGAVTNINRLQIRLVGGTNNVATQYALDYIQLQTGIAPPSFSNEIIIQKNGASVASRPIINFIEGTNTAIVAVDDIINDRVNVTISSSGGTGSDTYVTGFTYDNANTLTIKQNEGQPDLSVVIDTMTGLTVGVLSATTYLNLPTNASDAYIFSSNNSDISGYEQMVILPLFVPNAIASIVTTVSTTPTLLANFATNLNYPNTTVIPSGVVTIHFETEKNTGGNGYECFAEIYKRNLAGTETLLGTSDLTSEITTNVLIQQLVTILLPTNVTILTTDRIVVKIYANVISGANRNITLFYDDATNSRLQLPVTSISIAGLVPYVGANQNVNLGDNNLFANTISATTYLNTPYWTSGSTGNYSIKAKNDTAIDATGNYALAEGGNTLASGTASHAEGSGTTALGNSSHSEGYTTTASGSGSHAEGDTTVASGNFGSHSEGNLTLASGEASHAEGTSTQATNTNSHAEGSTTTAQGENSHAEGDSTQAIGNGSHAEGSLTQAIGIGSHAEGTSTTAQGNGAHAEGDNTQAIGITSHSEGTQTISGGDNSHAEGYRAEANAFSSHAEGSSTIASGDTSHAEGSGSIAGNEASHAEGASTTSLGQGSHSEGYLTIAQGDFGSHAEGSSTTALGESSHAEGLTSLANGIASHSEGNATTAQGDYSHAEGDGTEASGSVSHSEGSGTTAAGDQSHAEGASTIASGTSSHAEGSLTITYGEGAHAEGIATVGRGIASHAEGSGTTSQGTASHSEGFNTRSSADYSHAEGENTLSIGQAAHAEGKGSTASGTTSHAEGQGTQAIANFSHAEGKGSIANGLTSHAEGGDTLASGQYAHSEGFATTASGEASHAGGTGSVASGLNSFAHGSGSTASGINTVVLGNGITGTTNNTVFVPYFNIKSLSGDTSVTNLGIDANGYVTSGATTLWKNTTTGTVSSGTTNTVSRTQLIPANTFAAGNIIKIDWGSTNKTGALGAYTIRVYYNTSANLVGSPILLGTYTLTAAAAGARAQRRIVIKSATVTEYPTGATTLITDLGFNSLVSTNINWAVDSYFIFTVQNVNATDSSAISYYIIEKL